MKKLILTIGRQYGSGGREIGQIIAKRLNIDFYGQEELMAIAKEKPDYKEVRPFYEEQPVNSLLYAIAMNQDAINVGKKPFEGIKEIGEKASCVIVGRCGSFIFKDNPSCVRIFCYAPLKKRTQQISKKYNLSEYKAERLISKMEEDRCQFHQFYTSESRGRINNYDLCIDTSRLGIQGSADFICNYLKMLGYEI